MFIQYIKFTDLKVINDAPLLAKLTLPLHSLVRLLALSTCFHTCMRASSFLLPRLLAYLYKICQGWCGTTVHL